MNKLSVITGSSTALLKNMPTRVEGCRVPCVIKMLLMCFLSMMIVLQSVEAAGVNNLTLVSLTFDDGLRQSAAIQSLLDSGLKATFYVNSDKIRTSGPIDNADFLTKGELDTLFNNGNEIGGHTINHVDLATLGDAAQRQAICDDLVTLRGWYGDSVYSLAYPYASTGPTTQGIVAAGCPGTYGPLNKPVGKYESARTVGGVGCQGCQLSESLPPANPYYLATTVSVLSTTTLATLQNYVTQAEANSGGWVILVLHSVCNGCDTYSMTQETLVNFLTWLKARESQGTYVRTVHQVISGDYPPPPSPPPMGPNLLINPSLEVLGSNNLPDCWQLGDWGSSTGTWTRTTDAYTGGFAQRLQITSYNNGDRKLLPTLDAGQLSGGCAPSVDAGANYQIGAYYKATTFSTAVLFYLDANGVWQYWRDGPNLPASNDWAQMTHYTGTLPTGAKALSFGIALTSIGALTTDEYSMTEVLDSPPPTNMTPTFVGGTTTLTVVQDSSALDLKPNLHVSDTDTGQTETWTQSVAPTHGTLVFSGATASSGSADITPGGTITYQPAAGYSGSDSFTVRVSDSVAIATRAFTVTVTATSSNTGPTFVGGTSTLTVVQDSSALDLKPNLHVSDIDPGQTETWSQSIAPAHGTLVFSGATASSGSTNITPGGTITYQPVAGYNGSDSFTVQVSDGLAIAPRAFTVTVSATSSNMAPTFVGGTTTLSVVQDSFALDLKPNLHVSDTDTGQMLTWGQSVAPTHGTLVFSGATASSGSTNITPGGTITYQPVAGYNGSDSFTVQVSDGLVIATRAFTVTVTTKTNISPTFVGGTTSLRVRRNSSAVSLKSNLRVSDTDTGQTETWSQSTAPVHGTLVFSGATANSGSTNITPGGTITYQPVAGYRGSDSFTVQVSDGVATAIRTFTVTVR